MEREREIPEREIPLFKRLKQLLSGQSGDALLVPILSKRKVCEGQTKYPNSDGFRFPPVKCVTKM